MRGGFLLVKTANEVTSAITAKGRFMTTAVAKPAVFWSCLRGPVSQNRRLGFLLIQVGTSFAFNA